VHAVLTKTQLAMRCSPPQRLLMRLLLRPLTRLLLRLLRLRRTKPLPA
jgi:hypothetical protein